jgi:hypothetical protein
METPQAAGWYPDPMSRYDHRYWDGSTWTDQVSRGGIVATDPVEAEPGTSSGPAPAAAPAPAATPKPRPAPAPAPQRAPSFGAAGAPTAVAPPQVVVVQKKGGGCLKAIGIATVALVALIVVGVIIAAVSASNDAPKKVNGVASNSLNSDHPPQADVQLSTCATDEFGTANATGVITNHSTQASNYSIHIAFQQNGARVDDGYALESDVQPGQPTNFTAGGLKQVTGQVTCTVTSVERFAS